MLTGIASVQPLMMKLAMPVSPYPTLPRMREKAQTSRYANFTLISWLMSVVSIEFHISKKSLWTRTPIPAVNGKAGVFEGLRWATDRQHFMRCPSRK